MKITVSLSAIDGFCKSRSFRTLAGARHFAVAAVGEHPELGTGYAIADDGVVKVTVRGCTLAQLFTAPIPAIANDYRVEAKWDGFEAVYLVYFGARQLAAFDTAQEAAEHVGMCREHDAEPVDSAALRDLEMPF